MLPPFLPRAHAAEFASREFRAANNTTDATTEYELSFSGQSAGSVRSFRLQLCVNDPFPGQPCTAPNGLSFTAATLASQSGMSGFSLGTTTNANELIVTRSSPAPTTLNRVSFVLQNVHNPSNPGTVYARLESFTGPNATGMRHDAAGLAVAYLSAGLNVKSYVPPFLLFCIANTIQNNDCATAQGNYIDFGEFSPTRTAVGQTQMLVATNADYGYSIRVLGTTMTSGINALPALASSDVSRRGVSQFGLNLRANSVPAVGKNVEGAGVGAVSGDYNRADYFRFVPGETLVSSPDPDNFRLFTISYVANVSKDQAPGIYVSTLTYVALASF
ncbi:MAG: hypothetical protein WAQ24_00365 [Candidatus Saccharimonadales bacterium]